MELRYCRRSQRILGRFAEHFDQLLNIPDALDVGAASAIHVRPKVHCLLEPLNLKEVMDAIDATREGKAPGKRGILAEIWKYGGTEIVTKLHQLILYVWSEENVPQDWKDASIVLIFKKGSRKDCGNHKSIFLLSLLGRYYLVFC